MNDEDLINLKCSYECFDGLLEIKDLFDDKNQELIEKLIENALILIMNHSQNLLKEI